MLARNDADVYKLTADCAEKLSPIEAMKPGCFAGYKEFAMRIDDAAGLDRWAERKASEIMRQAGRDQQNKTKNNREEL